MDPDFVVHVKCTIFWLNGGLRVSLDLFARDFPKSSSQYLFCTEVVRKHGFRCFTAMCTFWIKCFVAICVTFVSFKYFVVWTNGYIFY